MIGISVNLPVDFKVGVSTTKNRGHTPEELAERFANKLVHVADSAPPGIREQAHAFKDRAQVLAAQYMREAMASDRVTVYNALRDAGHPELAELIRRL